MAAGLLLGRLIPGLGGALSAVEVDGISLPIAHLGSALPVGLQLLGKGGDDARLLAIARCVEDTLRH